MNEYVGSWTDDSEWEVSLGEPIVRCKDCIHSYEHHDARGRWLLCNLQLYFEVKPDGFCAWGEKRGWGMAMTPTSEERREVAEALRQMAEKHSAVEASRVAHALGLEYEVHGTVVAFGSDAVQALADLIEPTSDDDSAD